MASEELILNSLKRMKDAGLKGAPQEIGVDRLEIWAEVFDTISDEVFTQLVLEYMRSEEFFPAPGSLYKMAERRMETSIELAWRRVVQLSQLGVRRLVRRERNDQERIRYEEALATGDAWGLDPEYVIVEDSGFGLEHINDPYALWAMSQLENVETLGHREQPIRFMETKRAEFGRLYRAAFQRGYRLERWNGKPSPVLERHAEQLSLAPLNPPKALSRGIES